MNVETLSAWVLSLFTALAPSTPWVDTYQRSAEAIARASISDPLFAGEHGAAKTAATMTSIAWFESSLRPDAEGDCITMKSGKPIALASVAGRCPTGSRPRSFCLFQIGESNFAGLQVARADVQGSVEVCTSIAIRMAHTSFAICRARALEDRLAWYAAGGEDCAGGPKGLGLIQSRHRTTKGQWLFRTYPPPVALAVD